MPDSQFQVDGMIKSTGVHISSGVVSAIELMNTINTTWTTLENDASAFMLKTNAGTILSSSLSTRDITLSSTTESTTPTTGSLIVSGGLGVAKSLHVGGSINAYLNPALRTGFGDKLGGQKTLALPWNQIATSGVYYDICWSPEVGIFVALGFGASTTLTSYDGLNWTARSIPAANNWISLCWSPQLGIFCAVAGTGTLNRAMTSPDGLTWSLQTTPSATTTEGAWRSVCWSPEMARFVAVGTSGDTLKRAMYSDDGITWTLATTPVSNAFQSVVWGSELMTFVAISNTGSGRIMFSYDGISWYGRNSDLYAWETMCYSPELNLFVACAGSNMLRSSDALTWTAYTQNTGLTFRKIIWVAEYGMFVAVGSNASASNLAFSINGISWNSANTGSNTNGRYSIAWSPQLRIFAAGSSSGDTNRIIVSKKVQPKVKPPYFGFSRYEDLSVSPFSASTGPATKIPTILQLATNGAGSRGTYTYAFNNSQEQELYFCIQLPHSYEEGTDIEPHVHCTSGTSSTIVEWGLEYSWNSVNTTINSVGTTLISQQTTLNATAYWHNIAPLPTIVGTGQRISSLLVCRLYRKAGGTNTDVYLLSFDLHYRVNSIGSGNSSSKGNLA